ncbi:MAG: helicase-related protein [Candidatus Hodarchaeales archaeon]
MTDENSPQTVIQRREYQTVILKRLKRNFTKGIHCIAEVDTGLGKRVLTYLLIKEILPNQRVLLLLHSTTSYLETIHYFEKEYGGFTETDFQSFSSRTPTWLRKKIITKARIVASTPQTFANVFEKLPGNKPKFDAVIINEVDKIVRRQGDSRLLVFPYNTLIPYFIQDAWIVGMTGTLRDSHVFYDRRQDQIKIRDEKISLDKRIPDLEVISMDDLMSETDVKAYIQYTKIKKDLVEPSEALSLILTQIDQAIKGLREIILEEQRAENPTLLEMIPTSQLALVSGMLEANDTQKYNGLLLTRKYAVSMQVDKYRKFLYRLKKFGINKQMINAIPETNKKVKRILQILENRSDSSKTVVLCSYLDTAHLLVDKIRIKGFTPFLVTGKVQKKAEVLNAFKDHKTGKTVLIMTSVGERDIDIPQADLLIVYDVVNTVKTMYQRMKRTRGGTVLTLCYRDTFEEKKVNRLFSEIANRYPWSSIIK